MVCYQLIHYLSKEKPITSFSCFFLKKTQRNIFFSRHLLRQIRTELNFNARASENRKRTKKQTLLSDSPAVFNLVLASQIVAEDRKRADSRRNRETCRRRSRRAAFSSEGPSELETFFFFRFNFSTQASFSDGSSAEHLRPWSRQLRVVSAAYKVSNVGKSGCVT